MVAKNVEIAPVDPLRSEPYDTHSVETFVRAKTVCQAAKKNWHRPEDGYATLSDLADQTDGLELLWWQNMQGGSIEKSHKNFSNRGDDGRRIDQRHAILRVQVQRVGLLQHVVEQIAVAV